MTPTELRKLASNKPASINGNCIALIDWINSVTWALIECAETLEQLKEAAIKLEVSIAFDKAVTVFGAEKLAKALASWQPRDIDEDPIGYCIKRDGVLDLTCASKSIEMVGSRAFAENKWHPSSSIVVPLFARPGAG